VQHDGIAILRARFHPIQFLRFFLWNLFAAKGVFFALAHFLSKQKAGAGTLMPI
jgi:hypothetical protein